MRPNFGAWRAQARWWLHQACHRCGEMVCLLIRTTAQLLIRMQDGQLWKRVHQLLAASSHWCEIQASKRRARYVMATGVLLAVLGCAWGLQLKLHSVFHQTEIEQTDRAALDAIVKGIVDAGFSGKSDANHEYSRASDTAKLE
jgi:hypothetical protein